MKTLHLATLMTALVLTQTACSGGGDSGSNSKLSSAVAACNNDTTCLQKVAVENQQTPGFATPLAGTFGQAPTPTGATIPTTTLLTGTTGAAGQVAATTTTGVTGTTASSGQVPVVVASTQSIEERLNEAATSGTLANVKSTNYESLVQQANAAMGQPSEDATSASR